MHTAKHCSGDIASHQAITLQRCSVGRLFNKSWALITSATLRAGAGEAVRRQLALWLPGILHLELSK